MNFLKTAIGENFYSEIRPVLRIFLREMDKSIGKNCSEALEIAHRRIGVIKETTTALSDDALDDLFVLSRYIDFFYHYQKVWGLICNGCYSDSWVALQDCMDLIRIVKKFSRIDMSAFDYQLSELEKTYPYNFFSA